MTVEELMEHLEQMEPGAEVRFAYQPNYPLWGTIGGVAGTNSDTEVFLLQDKDGETGYAETELWELAR